MTLPNLETMRELLKPTRYPRFAMTRQQYAEFYAEFVRCLLPGTRVEVTHAADTSTVTFRRADGTLKQIDF